MPETGGVEPTYSAADPPVVEPPAHGAVGVSCAFCGTTASKPPLTWMYERDRGRGGRWFCQDCARQNLRAVEAKLEQEWW